MIDMQERIKRAFELAGAAGLEGPELAEFIKQHAHRAVEREVAERAQLGLDTELPNEEQDK